MAETAAYDIIQVFGRVRRLADRPTYTGTEKREIERMYEAVFGRPIRDCSCPDRWHDAAVEIHRAVRRKLANDPIMAAKVSKYYLRNGAVIEYSGKYYTHINITDEIAAAYLAAYPKAEKLFKVTPTAKKAAKAAAASVKAESKATTDQDVAAKPETAE